MSKKSAFKKIFIAGVFTSAFVFSAVPAFSATTLYEQIDEELLAKGINYQYKHRLTDEGWLDIYVLTADVSNRNISINPVESGKETGLKESTSSILGSSGAAAGVNGGYFGLAGNYSASFGPVISDGDILSVDTDKNINKNQFGTFFIEDGNLDMGYFKTSMNFVVDGEVLFDFASLNKITEMKYPVIFDRNGGEDTSKLDARFENLVKIVVEDDEITYISEKGETVKVPEDGYIAIISGEYAEKYGEKLFEGAEAEIDFECNFDFEEIETAVSGGGIILEKGQKADDIGEMASGRQPRTLLGFSKDKETVKLIVVDGKRSGGSNYSMGMTPDEAVQLLKDEGMYYGLNLDGGGSSTMAVKNEYGMVETVNNPAEGSERKVVTAVGIFDSSSVGKAESIIAESSVESVPPGGSFELKLYGYDKNHHKIMLDAKDVTFSIEGGLLKGNVVTAGESGTVIVKARYRNNVSECRVPISEITAITPSYTEVYLEQGESAELKVMGTTAEGTEIDLTDKVAAKTDFGSINNNIYTAPETAGGGIIELSYNGLTNYVKVSVGREEKKISSFEDIKYLNYSAYPADIEGIAGLTGKYVNDGEKALGLSYYFNESDETQAAYLSFAGGGMAIDGTPTELVIDIYGNGTGQWVRGKIEDANGKEFVIDFSRNVDWKDEYRTVKAAVPSDVKYPIKLTTIYVAALSNKITDQQAMYFDNLRGEFVPSADIELPNPIVGTDKLKADTSGKNAQYYYANISGAVVSDIVEDKSLYTESRVQVRNAVEKDADLSFFAGASDISPSGKTEMLSWTDDYRFYSRDGIDFVNLTAVKGGLKDTKAQQWQNFKNNVLETDNRCAVFIMDTPPSEFKDSLEAKLFEDVLQDLRADNRIVFVVSSFGTEFEEKIKDGIRYINLPSLWNEEGEVNDEFRIMRIKTDGEKINYEIKEVF